MQDKLTGAFRWWNEEDQSKMQGDESAQYQAIVSFAGSARGANPNAFDKVSEWILDDSEWSGDKLEQNRQILMQEIISRFKAQNAALRDRLTKLSPSGIVNEAVFKELDRFDHELSGDIYADYLKAPVAAMFDDFSVMVDRSVRKYIAGGKTGATGTDTVDIMGYINCLKDCDAGVQWTLFMPDVVKNQQNGFKVTSFEYKALPAMRFIGKEGEFNEDELRAIFAVLDAMPDQKSGFDYDLLFMHHYGRGVDVGPWHGFFGRMMKENAPVPEGFSHFDLVPEYSGEPGAPFMSKFAYAVFSGDDETLHKRDGYDSDAMYDVTRNIILGQGVCIPYPEKYWTAEVFLDGVEHGSSAYMFSANP